ncbi:MAG: DUF2974 domain-containing protein [Oscillospiraceae bacterium]|nr:DUF2974 domain-containing protein [Oscillospiraceae bacterium]
MANILDYIDWRGDLNFAQSPFNEVDNLILAELAFLDFAQIVSPFDGGDPITLRHAAALYFARENGFAEDMGVLVPDSIPELLRRCAQSARFGDVLLYGYDAQLDLAREKQFAAVSMALSDGTVYIAFRGTDDTLVGWKEDFNMSFLPVVPSQAESLVYLRRAAQVYRRFKLRLGGHSKGGNLAVYSAVQCEEAIQRRIAAVYNNDGPGFSSDILQTEAYRRMEERILTIVPQSSVVGMLLTHAERYTVVCSDQVGLWQHDGFSWAVRGASFVQLDDISSEGRFYDAALKELVTQLTPAQREAFSNALFEVLSATDAQTLTELREDGFRAAAAMVRTIGDLDKATRAVLRDTVRLLLRIGAKTLRGAK